MLFRSIIKSLNGERQTESRENGLDPYNFILSMQTFSKASHFLDSLNYQCLSEILEFNTV